ncbi:MAG: oligosaccharide flippase family protein [Prolixibacteraceae bacterium]
MSSYKSIIKSTGLIATVQVVQIIFGLIRNKVVAVVIGTKGFGIWGLYNTYIEMASAFSSLGLDQSGVRQIAKSNDEVTIAKTIWIFKRALIVVSSLTALLSILFSKAISISLFSTQDYYWGVIIVSFVILFNGISKGQKAILNGLRNLRYLAISQIIGAVIGSIACIALVYFFGEKGIPYYLLTIGLTAVLSTWWFVRKMNIKLFKPNLNEIQKELKQLFSLGIGFSAAGVIAAIMTWLSRIYLARNYDLSAVGIYQASWTISNLYIGTILTAMGVDFMPRIMTLINDPKKFNATVNEQIELGVLISSIGVVVILIFSPLVLHLLYSSEFMIGVNIIRWQVLGVSMRIIAFPFSYVIMAHNKAFTYAIVQTIFWVTDFLLLILFSNLWGFYGLGVNYFIAYFLYLFMTYMVSYKMFGFKFSKSSMKIIYISYVFIFIAWFLSQFIEKYNYFLEGVLVIAHGLFIKFYLKKYMGIDLVHLVRSKVSDNGKNKENA